MVIRLLLPLFFALAGCASAPVPEPSQAIAPDPSAPLVAAVQTRAAAHPGLSGFRLLANSEEAFAVRLALLQEARHSLDIQYYIVRDGLTTRLLLEQLLRAADRGVRVRLLLDDTSSDRGEGQIAALAAHPQIEVRLFNPLHLGRLPGAARNLGRLLDLSQQHRRMHNKLWLADNSLAIVGGRNLGDEYFDAGPARDFSDLDLLGAGPVAEQLGQSFDQYWNHRLSKPLEGLRWLPPTTADLARLRRQLEVFRASEVVRESPFAKLQSGFRRAARLDDWLDGLTWASGQALWDAPAKVLSRGEPDPHLLLTTQLAPLFKAVREELILVSAYFVPGEEGVDYLTGRADGGVSIRLLTNSLEATDVPAVHGGYAPYRRPLLEHGIRLFELRAEPERQPNGASWRLARGSSHASLHSKAVVFDRRKVFIGSFNLDQRSVLWNTEVGIVVDSPALAAQVRRLVRQGMAPRVSYEVRLQRGDGEARLLWIDERNGRRRVRTHEPGSWWRHLNAWLVRLIGLESML